MLSSLELRWLKLPKDLSLPLIVLCESANFWGLMHHPERGEVLLGHTYYPLDKGVLQINPKSKVNLVSVMVHEIRHHWQHANGWVYDGISTAAIEERFVKQGIVFPWWEASCEYFNRSRSEKDALMFQHKHAPDLYSTLLTEWFRKRKGRTQWVTLQRT